MNYHNFASRLSIQRLPSVNTAKVAAKPEPKKVRRAARRRFVAAAALVLVLCALNLRTEAAEQDGPRVARSSAWRVNVPTLLVTLTGLTVALLRIPTLWRQGLDC